MKQYMMLLKYMVMIACCLGIFMTTKVIYVQGAEVKELDLGDYETEMSVGEKQLLNVTALPVEAENVDVRFLTSNEAVATINGLGRITATGAGTTVITAICGTVKEEFTLCVKKKEDGRVSVNDLDLGDCPKEIEVGSSQILEVSVIPTDATEQNVTYHSSQPSVATVNALGRIMAVKIGKTKITISCDGISKSIWIKVVRKRDEEIQVTQIDVADYEKKLEVDKTMTLSVTTYPTNATNSEITYSSSNTKIATVSPAGEIKGISKGKVSITVSCGKVKKRIRLQVIVPTAKISLNSRYLVLKPGQQYRLKATVIPSRANPEVSFMTQENEVFDLNANGLVTAKRCGNGNIIVSNSDTSVGVTVIVNQEGKEDATKKNSKKSETEKIYSEVVSVLECPVISKDMLQYFYEERKTLTIMAEKYELQIAGNDIVNFDNSFDVDLQMNETEDGMEFVVNEGKPLCGKILLSWKQNGKYLYLYNLSKKKYELLSMQDSHKIVIDKEGKYLLTEEKISMFRLNNGMLGGAFGGLLVLTVIFVGVKRRYWFW